jgi:hypothetical protein
MGVHLINLHLTAVHLLIGVHLTGEHLMGVYLLYGRVLIFQIPLQTAIDLSRSELQNMVFALVAVVPIARRTSVSATDF